MTLEMLHVLLSWLELPPEPDVCPACGEATGDVLSLTRWPQGDGFCPHCGAALCPF